MKIQKGIPLYSNETLEDLQRNGFRMIQPQYGFRFGEDSVLLAAHAASLYSIQKRLMVADLGAGCGAMSLLLAARMPLINIWALELDLHRADCLNRNILLNNLCDRMTAVKIDLKKLLDQKMESTTWGKLLQPSSYDLVVANPPYRKTSALSKKKWDTGQVEERSRLLAVEEVALSINQLTAVSAKLLKPGGRFIVVHRPQRLPELLMAMNNYQLEPETLQVIESLPGRSPSRIIVSARRQGKSGGFRWLKPFRVCERPGSYTDEAKALYGNEPKLMQKTLLQRIEKIKIDWTE